MRMRFRHLAGICRPRIEYSLQSADATVDFREKGDIYENIPVCDSPLRYEEGSEILT